MTSSLPTVDYATVARNGRRTLRALLVTALVLALVGVALYVFTTAIPDARYADARRMFDEHSYAQAAATFADLGSWRDSPAMLVKCARANTAIIPDSHGVTWLGVLDGNPIGWERFGSSGSSIGLVAKYVVASRSYNTDNKSPVSWGKSTLRAWLNGDFLDAAFTADQRAVLSSLRFTAGSDEVPSKMTGKIVEPDSTDVVSLVPSDRLSNVPTHDGHTRTATGVVSTTAVDWWLKSSLVKVTRMNDVSYDGKKFTITKWAQNDRDAGQYWYTSDGSTRAGNKGVRPVIYVRS